MKKFYKKLWLLALLAVMPIANVVAQNVAKIGDTGYATLADAVAAVPTNGTATTITMTANTTETAGVVVAAGQNVVIDLKGRNITGSVNGKLITNNGTLTIKGTGCVYNQDISAQGHDAVYNTGTLVVNGGIFGDKNSTMTDANDVNRGAAVRNYGGTATINGGSFTACDNFTNGGYAYALINDNNGTMTINNATVYGKNNGNIANNYGSVTVKGGTYTLNNTESYYSLYVDGEDGAAVTTVEGGIFNNTTKNGLIHTDNATNASVEIEGGSFTYTKLSNQNSTNLKLEVSGGSFPTDVTAYMESGSAAVQNGDGSYVINPVAQIGENKYESLAAAVKAVSDNTPTTITVIANQTINVVGSAITIPAGKNITIDLNGYQVVGTAEGGSTSALITNNGTLTIKDSSDTNKDGTGTGKLISGATTTWIYDGSGNFAGSYASNTITNSGTLTIESGYIENLSTGSATYAVDNNSTNRNAVLNMNGGVLKAHSVAVREFANSTTNENTVNVNGGTVTAGYSGIWIQLPGSNAAQAVKAALNVTGGTLDGGSYAFYDSSYGNSYDATQYNLSGGTFNGAVFNYGGTMEISEGNGTEPVFNGNVSRKGGDLTISGGTFNGYVYIYGTGEFNAVSGGTFNQRLYPNTNKEFISGGTFAYDPTDYCVDGYAPTTNAQGEYVVEAITEFVLYDGTPYTYTTDVVVPTAKYVRSFDSTRVKKYQGWFVPFDYTITAADLQKFKFFKIDMIAHSAVPGEVGDPNKLWIHILPMAEDDVLEANKPYVFTPQEESENYEFTTTNATLKALTNESVTECSTTTEVFNFYGVYSPIHPVADDTDIFYYMAKSGQLSYATKTTTTVGANRWIFRVTNKSGQETSGAYSIGFVVNGIEDDDVTAVSSATAADAEVVGYYTLSGQKVSEPTEGVYVVKYADGTSKKVVF